MKSALSVIALFSIVVLSSGLAVGATFSFDDTVIQWPDWGGNSNEGDVIEAPQITGGTGNIDGAGNLTGLSVSYSKSSVYIAGGDLFIDKGADSTWDYVLTTWDWKDQAPNPNAVTPVENFKIYDLGNLANRNVSNGDLYHFAQDWGSGFDVRDNHPYGLNLDTSLAGGLTEIGTYTFVDFEDSGSGSVQFKEFLFSDGYNLSLGSDDFIIGFGSTCANDVIYETVNNPVPIPGSLLLLGSGIVGLVGLRRRDRPRF